MGGGSTSRGFIWVFILKKLPVSFAYPVMSLSFVLMLPVSRYFFNETVTPYKAVGSLLIVAGVICTALGSLRIKQEGRDW
ncbi:MAG: hypothetical protein CVU89_12580 [Firmicutes bacterium HGW-Firmicutes-14]|nr:MAG: hypothetical protein CVU89_12580 [Firmicutes bacterium HGW-Firmicutes-14]